MKYFNTYKNTFSLVLLLVIFQVSCTKIIDIELEQAPRLLVVNSLINPDSTVAVNLSLSRHILDNAKINELTPSSGGPTVKLYANDNYVEDLQHNSNMPGWYLGSVKPDKGVKYSVEVDHPIHGSVTSECRIPNNIPINTVDTTTVGRDSDDEYYYYDYYNLMLQCDIEFNDPKNEKNYYMIDVDVSKSYMEFRDTSYFVVDSVFVNSKWIYDFREITYYYKPAIRRENNIHFVSNDLAVDLSLSANSHFVFDDNLFDGSKYKFKTTIPYNNLVSLDSAIVNVKLKSISEDYYKYLKTRSSHVESKDDFFTTPVIVFNNIEGGAGIMGAYSTSNYEFTIKIVDPNDYYYY